METKSGPLENFKFDLENSSGGYEGVGGSARQHTVSNFPVAKSIAAVSMRLQPGALRELHWHAIAAEWAYIISGHCRVTVYSPNGQEEISDFGPGDVWYFPRGHAHSIQGLPPSECHFILVFDNGEFSEFGTSSITDWITQTPLAILQQNIGKAAPIIKNKIKGEVYIVEGPPPTERAFPRNTKIEPSQLNHKYSLSSAPPILFEGGSEQIVSSKEFPISTTLTGVILKLKPGALRELHWHPNADEWQYYIAGQSEVGLFSSNGRSRVEQFAPGQVAFVNRGFGHYIKQTGNQETIILIVMSAGTYEEISLSGWLASNPDQLLATNFSLTPSEVNQLPDSPQFIIAKKE